MSDKSADAAAAGEWPIVDADLGYRIQQFYFHEAELLDDGRFADWLDLMADDLEYWAPTRTNRLRRQQALSIAKPGEAAFYDETKDSLAWRIRRFDSGMAWAEDPPSRTRHIISNIVARRVPDEHVTSDAAGEEYEVRSAFLVWRSRLERELDLYAGSRTDRLRATDEGFTIARRTILFDSNVLMVKNISTFF